MGTGGDPAWVDVDDHDTVLPYVCSQPLDLKPLSGVSQTAYVYTCVICASALQTLNCEDTVQEYDHQHQFLSSISSLLRLVCLPACHILSADLSCL